MKRRVTAGILVVCMIAVLAGCGTENKQESQKPKPEVTATPAPVQEVTATPEVTAEPTPAAGEKKIEIELPSQAGLVTDYSKVEGIKLEKGTYIAMVGKNTESGYWKAVKAGAKQAVSELNAALGYTGEDKIRMSFEGPKVESDIESQINVIDAVLADNPDALCLGIIDIDSCQAQIETARENGIPVIVMDSGIGSDTSFEGSTICATDNTALGAEAAKRLSAAIQDTGKVAVIAHHQNTQTSIDRVNGFVNEMTQNHPQITLTETIYDQTETGLNELAAQLLAENPDLTGVFCTNESVYKLVREKLHAFEGNPLQIVGVDSGETQVQDVKDGKELGFLTQNPYAIGYATITAAGRTIKRQENSQFIDTGFFWVDQSNVESEEIQKYLYK